MERIVIVASLIMLILVTGCSKDKYLNQTEEFIVSYFDYNDYEFPECSNFDETFYEEVNEIILSKIVNLLADELKDDINDFLPIGFNQQFANLHCEGVESYSIENVLVYLPNGIRDDLERVAYSIELSINGETLLLSGWVDYNDKGKIFRFSTGYE